MNQPFMECRWIQCFGCPLFQLWHWTWAIFILKLENVYLSSFRDSVCLRDWDWRWYSCCWHLEYPWYIPRGQHSTKHQTFRFMLTSQSSLQEVRWSSLWTVAPTVVHKVYSCHSEVAAWWSIIKKHEYHSRVETRADVVYFLDLLFADVKLES